MDFDFAARMAVLSLPTLPSHDDLVRAIRVAVADAHEAGRIDGRLEILTNTVTPAAPN